MRIGSNIFSLSAQHSLNRAEGALRRSLERLSSGYRINAAMDDTAGLSMATRLESRIRGDKQAVRNVNDGLSLLALADGALSEMTNILQSVRELAVQAANGTLSTEDRNQINSQVQALMNEYERITSTTEFSQSKLLNGSLGTLALQVGTEKGETIDIGFGDLRKEAIFEKTVGTGTFQAHKTYFGGNTAYDLAIEDLNGDEIADIVSASADDDAVYVLIGNGDGSFKSSQSYSAGDNPQRVALGDLNGDGIADMVVTSANDSAVNILIGNGDGSFRPKTSMAGTDYTLSVALLDANHDGFIDLAIGGAGIDSPLQVFLGNGNGTFKAPQSYDVYAMALSVDDFNNDGNLDLFSTDSHSDINILLGNGDGTFKNQNTINLPFADGMSDISAGDLNGDGFKDMVAVNNSMVGESLYVFLGNGDGTFKAHVTYGSTNWGTSINLGDVNGDEILDAIVGGDSVAVHLGNGDGTFKAMIENVLYASPYGIELADLNKDGVLDISTATQWDGFDVLLGNSRQVSALPDLTLTDSKVAQAALPILDRALGMLTAERASLGSFQSRLDTTLDSLYMNQEILSEAHSELIDADIAEETAELVRNQILQQAGIAMLAQANLMQGKILELLRY